MPAAPKKPAEPQSPHDPKVVGTLEHDRQLWTASFDPAGTGLAAGGYDALVQRWNLAGEKPEKLTPLAGHNGWVQRLAFAGQRLITTDSWGRMIAWDDPMGEAKQAWNLEQALAGWIRDAAVSPDGSVVAVCGNDPAVKLFQTADGKLVGELPGHPDDVFCVAFDPEGKRLAVGDFKGVIRMWDVAAKKITAQFDAPGMYRLDRLQDCGGVRRLVFDPTGKQLLACGMKDPPGGFSAGAPLALLMDAESGKVLHELQHGDKNQGFLYDALFHPDGYIIGASCALTNTGLFWGWRPGEPKPFFSDKKLSNGRSLSLDPTLRRLALVSSISRNANGRPKNAPYIDGTALIHLVELPTVDA